MQLFLTNGKRLPCFFNLVKVFIDQVIEKSCGTVNEEPPIEGFEKQAQLTRAADQIDQLVGNQYPATPQQQINQYDFEGGPVWSTNGMYLVFPA
jgi:hypothetical protein